MDDLLDCPEGAVFDDDLAEYQWCPACEGTGRVKPGHAPIATEKL